MIELFLSPILALALSANDCQEVYENDYRKEGTPVKTTKIEENLVTCPDGTVINRKREITQEHVEITLVHTEDWESPSGEYECYDVETSTVQWELRSETVKELGQICPTAQGVCCVPIEFGSVMEIDPSLRRVEKDEKSIPITCADGSPGVKTIKTRTVYQLFRWKYWEKTQPLGNCGPQDECSTAEWHGPWLEYVVTDNTWTEIDCDTPPNPTALVAGVASSPVPLAPIDVLGLGTSSSVAMLADAIGATLDAVVEPTL